MGVRWMGNGALLTVAGSILCGSSWDCRGVM